MDRMSVVVEALNIMWQGMLGIMVVMFVLFVVVSILPNLESLFKFKKK